MRKKWLLPLTVSVLILIIGAFSFYKINEYWLSNKITISNPIINKVTKSKQPLDLKSIIHEAEKQVIQIEGITDDQTVTGSGFIYNDQGDIITNAHVIQDADMIYVRTASAHVYPAAVIGIGKDTDIAVIRVPELAGQPVLGLEKEVLAEIGDEVIALGSPHGFQNTVTLGIISGSERNFTVDGYDYNNLYQISAQITQGNSGGPLINRSTGNVIGINSVGTNDGTIGFSIPISEVIDQVEKWSAKTSNDKLKFGNMAEISNHFDSDQLEEDSDYLIDYFIEGIQMRDYVNAYTLLGSNMQSEMSYTDFRDDYTNIVKLSYEKDSSNITDDNHAETVIKITIESKTPKKEKNSIKKSEYVFTIGLENDQLRILKIKTG